MKKLRLFFVVLLTSVFYNVKAETSVWDGYSYSFDWYTNSSGTIYHIKTAADLAGLSRCFSTGYYIHGKFEGKTVILDNDIDLAGYEWTPIGIIDASNTSFEFAGTSLPLNNSFVLVLDFLPALDSSLAFLAASLASAAF